MKTTIILVDENRNEVLSRDVDFDKVMNCAVIVHEGASYTFMHKVHGENGYVFMAGEVLDLSSIE